MGQGFSGRVKCVYSDQPYNTGSALEHYAGGLEYSIWLGRIRDRIEMLCKLLLNDSSPWISVDDGESSYLKVMADGICGRVILFESLV
ncbi:MAG: hypothetical protein LBO65_07945 [Spirochaetaceae bacterium]|nr:hypothetical protein [Spirochaetaceae bacterium]